MEVSNGVNNAQVFLRKRGLQDLMAEKGGKDFFIVIGNDLADYVDDLIFPEPYQSLPILYAAERFLARLLDLEGNFQLVFLLNELNSSGSLRQKLSREVLRVHFCSAEMCSKFSEITLVLPTWSEFLHLKFNLTPSFVLGNILHDDYIHFNSLVWKNGRLLYQKGFHSEFSRPYESIQTENREIGDPHPCLNGMAGTSREVLDLALKNFAVTTEPVSAERIQRARKIALAFLRYEHLNPDDRAAVVHRQTLLPSKYTYAHDSGLHEDFLMSYYDSLSSFASVSDAHILLDCRMVDLVADLPEAADEKNVLGSWMLSLFGYHVPSTLEFERLSDLSNIHEVTLEKKGFLPCSPSKDGLDAAFFSIGWVSDLLREVGQNSHLEASKVVIEEEKLTSSEDVPDDWDQDSPDGSYAADVPEDSSMCPDSVSQVSADAGRSKVTWGLYDGNSHYHRLKELEDPDDFKAKKKQNEKEKKIAEKNKQLMAYFYRIFQESLSLGEPETVLVKSKVPVPLKDLKRNEAAKKKREKNKAKVAAESGRKSSPKRPSPDDFVAWLKFDRDPNHSLYNFDSKDWLERGLNLARNSNVPIKIALKNILTPRIERWAEITTNDLLLPEEKLDISSSFSQMTEFSEYLRRELDSKKDERVRGFLPDKWQRELLDCADEDDGVSPEACRGRNMLIVAPTSSGKTFISYYLMKKVLQMGDKEVIVFVAPTQALVNQTASEVKARYCKESDVVGIFMRNYRDKDLHRCQVIVTVPACLSILLLSWKWQNWRIERLKWVIFDEIHTLGSDEGPMWELSMHFLRHVRIVGLSATLSNPDSISNWLKKVTGRDVLTIQVTDRYNDLRLSVLSCQNMNSEGKRLCLKKVSPLQFIAEGSKIPNFLLRSLEPTEVAEIAKSLNLEDKLPVASAPHLILSRQDVSKWAETNLPGAMSSYKIPQLKFKKLQEYDVNILELFELLKESQLLPCIIFILDISRISELASELEMSLQVKQKIFWENIKNQEKFREKLKKYRVKMQELKIISNQISGKKLEDDEKLGKVKAELSEAERDLLQFTGALSVKDVKDDVMGCQNMWYTPNFTLFRNKSIDVENMRKLRRKCNQHFLSLFFRGIGIHHRQMSNFEKRMVETYMRTGEMQITFATSTLSLGINMPAKTSVFLKDSIFLDKLNFDQMRGRAGRRGFDMIGHTVVVDVGYEKVRRLYMSPIPSVVARPLLDPPTLTRILALYNHVDGDKKANSRSSVLKTDLRCDVLESLRSVALNPLSGPSNLLLMQHQLYFLWKLGLINDSGLTRDAEIIVRMNFVNSCFLVVNLLPKLDQLFSKYESTQKNSGYDLILNLCSRLFSPLSLCEDSEDKVLPDIPEEIAVEGDHLRMVAMQSAVDFAKDYTHRYFQTHPPEDLPISKAFFRADIDGGAAIPSSTHHGLTSSFLKLAGFIDSFETSGHLYEMQCHIGIPQGFSETVNMLGSLREKKLSSLYLYFYKQSGDSISFRQLQNAFKMREDDIFDKLNQFNDYIRVVSVVLQEISRDLSDQSPFFHAFIEIQENFSSLFSNLRRQRP